MRALFTKDEASPDPVHLTGEVEYPDGTSSSVLVDVTGVRPGFEIELVLGLVEKPPNPGGQGDRG